MHLKRARQSWWTRVRWHWVVVHRSPDGKLWSNDPLESRVKPISPSEFGSRFEIIVDANTGKPITPDKASSYKNKLEC